MPLYEYECPKCGTFERIQKFSDPLLEKCPTCGGAVAKLLSAPAIQFKGAGWYVTDYASKSKGGEAKAGDTTAGDGKGGETKAAEAKPAEAKPGKSEPSEGSTKSESAAKPAATSKTGA